MTFQSQIPPHWCYSVTKWSDSGIVEVQKITKGNEKCIFETPYNEMKGVQGVKESNFDAKNASQFSDLLMVRTEGVQGLLCRSWNIAVDPNKSTRAWVQFCLLFSSKRA